MTLKELIDSDSRLKSWRIRPEHRTPGVDIPLAETPNPLVSVAELKDEFRPLVRDPNAALSSATNSSKAYFLVP